MRRRLESLLPVLVLVGFLAAALTVDLMLSSAEERGVNALEESVTAEVQAMAGSQDQRFVNQFSGAQGLSKGLDGKPFELTVDSVSDANALQDLLDLFASAELRAGFYLLDLDDTITQGVMFSEDVIGSTFDRPAFAELKEALRTTPRPGGVLPVGHGLTTNEPVLIYVFAIREDSGDPARPGPLRGTFVFEQVVAADSSFNKEVSALKRGETGSYYFFDRAGTVVASNNASAIGEPLDTDELRTAEPGFHRSDGEVRVVADVPAPQWRVAFRQDADEFDEPLAGPLQTTGRVLILALLSGGLLLMGLLLRRLRTARAEQERLRVLTEAQQEFISIVSHELRTPVAGVLGFLETSLDHWEVMEDEERRTAVGRALANARRLQAMTRDVLDTQTIEAGPLVHVFEPLDLAQEAVTAVAAASALDPDRVIEVTIPDEPVWIEGDTDRLQQVLVNLIDNARKNSPSMEPIAVTVARADGGAQVTVSDRGPGIPDESLERIFDKFVRGRGDTVSGTGLGLYISRQIISAHEGRIWAESEPGRGATFRFEVPSRVSPAETASTAVVAGETTLG